MMLNSNRIKELKLTQKEVTEAIDAGKNAAVSKNNCLI